MRIIRRQSFDIVSSEITPLEIYQQRRRFLCEARRPGGSQRYGGLVANLQ